MLILGFDPGGSTGVAMCSTETYRIETIVITSDDHHASLEHLLLVNDPDVVVCERFDYEGHRMSVELISVEYIGVLRLVCKELKVPFILQPRLKGKKGLWTDDKLKALDLYASTPHERDATRQILYYLSNSGDLHFVQQYKEKL